MQRKLQRAAILTAFVTLIGSAFALPVYALAVAQAGQAAPEPAPVVGELTRVNPDAKMISVKSANGIEVNFKYTDATAVTGAEKSVAGLATMSGAQVTVKYKVEGSSNVATSIEVRNKS